MRFKLCRSQIAIHPELLQWIVINDFLICGLHDHLKTHRGWHAYGIQGGELGFVTDHNMFHLNGRCLAVGADREATFRNRSRPKKTGRRDARMKIVDFIRGSNLPLKQRMSYMNVRAGLLSSRGPIFSLHDPVVGAGCAERDSIAFTVGAHADETVAPSD